MLAQKSKPPGRAGKVLFSHRRQCNLGPAFPFLKSIARRPNQRESRDPYIRYMRLFHFLKLKDASFFQVLSQQCTKVDC